MDKIGILTLGFSAALFAVLGMVSKFGARGLWPAIFFAVFYMSLGIWLFFSCKCGDEASKPPYGR
jgi:hypothetical protein